jgi:endonuclease YncB( thermonuclease family)
MTDLWPLYHYRGEVTRVIDGDTIEVMLDLGCRVYQRRRVRLLGYDAPELFSGDEREAGTAAREELLVLLPIGSTVYLKTQLDRTSFDRILAWAYVLSEDRQLAGIADLMTFYGTELQP